MTKPDMQERPEDLLGKTIAERYQLLEIIGQGGIGVVYKAKHTLMNRIVAFKMLRSESLRDERNRKRFQQEAEAISSLNHPNIVSVFDFGFTQDNSAFLVMDFLDGKDLDTLIQEEGYLTPEEVAPIFMQICDAMTQSHQHGIIHRDLKPGNIIVVKEGKKSVAKLVDFGMAKFEVKNNRKAQSLTQPGEVFGSPYYMSPEQCIGSDLDTRSDIYSMGVLMYEAVTGQPPFLANNMVEMAQMHIYEQPREISKVIQDPDFPDWLQKIIFKALEKNVNDRYQTTEELKQALGGFVKFWSDKTGGGVTKPVAVRQATTTKNLKAEIEAAKALLIAQGIPIPAVLMHAEKLGLDGKDNPSDKAPGAPSPPSPKKDATPGTQPSPPASAVATDDANKTSGTIKVAIPKNTLVIVSVIVALLLVVCLILFFNKHSAGVSSKWQDFDEKGRKAYDAGRLSDAEHSFNQAIQVVRNNGERDNPELYKSLVGLASVYQREGKYESAENVLLQTLAGIEKYENSNSSTLAPILLKLGKLYCAMDRLDEAEAMHRRTMAIVEAAFGHDDPMMAEVLNDYAQTKRKKGLTLEAKDLQERSDQIRHKKKYLNEGERS